MDNKAIRKVVLDVLCAAFDRAAVRFRKDVTPQHYRDLLDAMTALRYAVEMRPVAIAATVEGAHPRQFVKLFCLLAER